jgi:predicted transcriptional regulator
MPVHRAVLTAFRGPYPGKGFEARHLDGNKQNNRLGNLAWGTRRENADDRIRHGSCRNKYRLKDEVVGAIRAEYASGLYTQSELAAGHGVSPSCVSSYVIQKLPNSGERNGNAKLTFANVLHIRLFHYFGIKGKESLASEFQVTATCIDKIVKNQRWVYP